MKKQYLLFMLGLVLIYTLTADVITLTDLANPDSITVTEDEVILTQGPRIFIYNLKDLKLKKSFGKEGEGPREFKVTSYMEKSLVINIQPGRMLVSSVGKLSIYDRSGKYIKEIKSSHNAFGNRFIGLGKGYVGTGTANTNKKSFITLNIHDKKLNKLKEVYKWASPYQPGVGTSVYQEPIVFQTFNNNLYIVKGANFKIDIFNKKGNKIHSFNQNYKKIKVAKQRKDQVIKYLKTDPATKNIFQYMKPIVFPEHYPAIRTFLIADEKIYIVTYERENNKNEFIVLNLKGKFVKKVFLTLNKKDLLNLYPFTIKNGVLYQLFDNEETEQWELHSQKI